MIKMTRGTYSLKGENGLTHLVGRSDEPFDIPDYAGGEGEEARLVEAGVAEYVGKAPRKETPSEDTPDIPDENPDEEPKKKKPVKRR